MLSVMSTFPVKVTLCNRYGRLFNLKSFDRLREIVNDNLDGLTPKEKLVIGMRFNKLMRQTKIGEKLNTSHPNIFYYEVSAMEKILFNSKAKKIYGMGKDAILKMPASALAQYIPYHGGKHKSNTLRSCLSNMKGIKVYKLVEMGRSVVTKGLIGERSYEHLADFLAGFDISLTSRVPYYKHVMDNYVEAFSVSSLKKLKLKFSKYSRVLSPLEAKILEMRIKGDSLRDLEDQLGLSYERVRLYESRALAKVRFHNMSLKSRQQPAKVLTMKVSEFVEFLPPRSGHTGLSRVRNVLSREFSEHNLAYLVENPVEMAKCSNFSSKSYQALRSALKVYNVVLPDVDYFSYLKRFCNRG